MEVISNDNYRLSTGREFYANHLIIGMDPSLECVYYGYDGHIQGACRHETTKNITDLKESWTLSERQELANYMIKLWQDYRTLSLCG